MDTSMDPELQNIQEEYQGPSNIQNSQQLEQEENINEKKYCGGLLNKSDPFLLKVLKIFLVIPLLPLVLIYKCLQCTYYAVVSFCENQVYNCLVYLYEKCVILCNYIELCLEKVWEMICNCFECICTRLKRIIVALGKCSLNLLDMYANFAMKTIVKFAQIRAAIQEFTSIISVPITLKIIVPFFMFIYYYIYTPICNCIVQTTIFSYRRILVPFCHFCKFIVLQIWKCIKFTFQTIIYETIILNTIRAIRWIAINFYNYIILNFFKYVIVNFYRYIILKFLYRIVLVSLYKLIKAIFYDFLYKIVCVNTYKGLRYFVVEILYNIILYNIYRAIKYFVVEILYNIIFYNIYRAIRYFCVKIVYAALKYFIVRILYEIILCNIWKCQKWLCIQIYNVMVFIYEKVIVNLCRCLRWILIEFFYKMILKNLYDYIIEPSCIFLYKMVALITKFIINNLIKPIWKAITFIFNQIVKCISIVFSFIYNEVLQPLWRITISMIRQLFNYTQKIFVGLGNLVQSIWQAIKNLFTRRRSR